MEALRSSLLKQNQKYVLTKTLYRAQLTDDGNL